MSVHESAYKLRAVYRTFVTPEMDAIVGALEEAGRNEEADEVRDVQRKLRDICNREVTAS